MLQPKRLVVKEVSYMVNNPKKVNKVAATSIMRADTQEELKKKA